MTAKRFTRNVSKDPCELSRAPWIHWLKKKPKPATKGGKRSNAGRKPIDPKLKKHTGSIAMKKAGWKLLDRERGPAPRGELIEDMLHERVKARREKKKQAKTNENDNA